MEAWKREISAYEMFLDNVQPDGVVLSSIKIILADLTLSSAFQLF